MQRAVARCVTHRVRAMATQAAGGAGTNPPPPMGSRDAIRTHVKRADYEGYMCTALMPSHAREPMLAMRSFNLELASVRDASRGNVQTARMRMAFWRQFVAAAYEPAAGGNSHPLFKEFAGAVKAKQLSRAWLDRLIDARDADLDAPPPATLGDLERYGEMTAGSLTLLALEACGAAEDAAAEEAAVHLGRAAGITTALRALPVTARLGQRYIPTDFMHKHGLSERDLRVVLPDDVVLTADGTPLAAAVEATASALREGELRPATAAAAAAPTGSSAARRPAPTAASSPVPPSSASPRSAPGGSPFGGAPGGAGGSFGGRAGGSRTVAIRRDDDDASSSRDHPALRPRPAASAPSAPSSHSGSAPASQPPSPPLPSSPSSRSFSTSTRAFAASAGASAECSSPHHVHGPDCSNGKPEAVNGGASGATSAPGTAGGLRHFTMADLSIVKPPETAAKIAACVREMHAAATAHVAAARALSPRVSHTAVPALLTAVPLASYLHQLAHRDNFNPFACGLYPWRDRRAYGRLALQGSLFWHVLRGTY